MMELSLVFLGGLLGSAHCVGMCGGFAVLIGAPAKRLTNNLARQLIYSSGRIFTYCALGGVVGYGGLWLAQRIGGFVHVQAVIAILAGVLLVTQGLISTGVVRYARTFVRRRFASAIAGHCVEIPAAGMGCLAGGMVGAFLRDRRWSHVFLAGVFTGLLPCGLVYAFVALAASTSDMFRGMATMAAFGLGTIPLMVLTGSGATLFSLVGRRRLLTLAAWCVVLTGMLSIARGASFLSWTAEAPTSCPLCHD